MFVYTHVCFFAHVCVFVHMFVYMYVFVLVHMFVFVLVHMFVCVHVCMCACAHVCVCTTLLEFMATNYSNLPNLPNVPNYVFFQINNSLGMFRHYNKILFLAVWTNIQITTSKFRIIYTFFRKNHIIYYDNIILMQIWNILY